MASHKDIIELAIQGEYAKVARAIKFTEDVSASTIFRALQVARENGKLETSQQLMGQAREVRGQAQSWLDLEADSLK